MKFLSFQAGKVASYGAVIEGGVFDLGKRFGRKYPTLRAALRAGKLGELTRKIADAGVNLAACYAATRSRIVFSSEDAAGLRSALGM